MAERRRRIVPGEMYVGCLREDQDLVDPGYEIVEEWVPTESTEEWTDWERVGEKIDQDPTYSVEYDYRRAGLFHVPFKALHPHRRRTVTMSRRLVRRWVDAIQGPMVQVVDVETRTERY